MNQNLTFCKLNIVVIIKKNIYSIFFFKYDIYYQNIKTIKTNTHSFDENQLF